MSIQQDIRALVEAANKAGVTTGSVSMLYWVLEGCLDIDLDTWAEGMGYEKGKGGTQLFEQKVLLPILGPERAERLWYFINRYWQ